jgi:hypothetical protein
MSVQAWCKIPGQKTCQRVMQKFWKVDASAKGSISVISIAFLHASFSDHLHLIAWLELGRVASQRSPSPPQRRQWPLAVQESAEECVICIGI